MILCTTPADMQIACRELRSSGNSLGLVPTMGALHAGHMSLVAAARADCDHVVASIFVNPTQFGPNEDFTSYPRTFDQDCRKLEDAGVDLLFAPAAADIYPPGNTTFVDPGEIATRLDGASRPAHFRGVATIVTRLFNIVAPDRAYFGQKDAAQVAVLRHITRDLNLPIHISVCPIVREHDGLAMSSRNRFLSTVERQNATVLIRSLRAAEDLICKGENSAETIHKAILTFFPPNPNLRLDYAAIVDPNTLLPISGVHQGALLAVAAWIGETRLIDNLMIHPR